MRSRRILRVGLSMILVVALAVPAMAAPSSGNGGKEVIAIDDSFGFDCPGGGSLTISASGWIQFKSFENGKRNLEKSVFHIRSEYVNQDGETFVWMDVGPDKLFVIDGVEHVSLTGRPGFVPDPDDPSGAGSLSGRMIINLETGEIVEIAGNFSSQDVDERACAALT